MVKRVTMREFQQRTSKWLKDLPIYVTLKGLDEVYVCRASDMSVATRGVATKDKVATSYNPRDNSPMLHGCGCRKEESNLCKKHGRV